MQREGKSPPAQGPGHMESHPLTAGSGHQRPPLDFAIHASRPGLFPCFALFPYNSP